MANQFDPVTVLPEAAKLKFIALRDAREDALASSRHAATLLEDARTALNDANVAIVLFGRQMVGKSVAEESRLMAVKVAAENEMARLSANAASRQERTQAIARLVSRLERYIGELPVTTKFTMYATANGSKRGKEAPAEVVSKARDEIAALKTKLVGVEQASYPREEILAAMEVQVRALAAAGAPDLDGLISNGAAIAWPDEQHLVGPNALFVTATPALLCWLFPEAVMKRLAADIEEVVDDDSGGEVIARAERPKRISAIREQMLAVERLEESAIEEAAKSGADIPRRSDSDPRAVLQLSSALPAPRD